MNLRLEWIDVFATAENAQSYDSIFDRLGNHFFDFYRILQHTEPIRFTLTKQQQTTFNAYFEQTQLQYYDLCGKDYVGTVRRLGLITFRVALVISALRIMQTGDFSATLVCTDTDFNTAMEIVKVLVQHAAKVFQMLPNAEIATAADSPKMALFNALPAQFDRAKYIEVAKRLQIPESTADKQIARFLNSKLLTRQAHGSYTKILES